jgi:ketosteroid isomerase-like protein
MVAPADTVRSFYSAIAARDVETSKRILAGDVEWITVDVWPKPDADDGFAVLSAFINQTLADQYGKGWTFTMNGRGPLEVAENVLAPFIEGASIFSPSPVEFRAENDKVVWLGSMTMMDKPSGETTDLAYAHVWTVSAGRLSRLREFSYLPAIPIGRVQ